MIGFAVVFGLLAVFLAQTWLNNQAAERLRSLEAQHKEAPPARTIVVASKPLHFGDVLTSSSLREMPWPENALPVGSFARIADLTATKRLVLTPIEVNEAILASRITGPGQRATLSSLLHANMKAVTIRVNDVEGVAGFVLPGDHVDVVLTRPGEKKFSVNDVIIQDARVLAIDQLADERTDKPAVVKAVTLEVDEAGGQKLALSTMIGTLSLMLRRAGETVEERTRQMTVTDLGSSVPVGNGRFATIIVLRPTKDATSRDEYRVPVERARVPISTGVPMGALSAPVLAHN